MNNIAKCTNTAQVNELLIPTNLQQQKLKILTSEGKNFTSEGKPVFTTQNKLYPKINFNDIDLEKNYSKSWQAYNVIYTNNILTEETPDLANSTIYDINVNDEITISLIMIMANNYNDDDAGFYNNNDHD